MRLKMYVSGLMLLGLLLGVSLLAGCATAPLDAHKSNLQSVVAHLQQANAALIPVAAGAAEVAELATGNPELIPLTQQAAALAGMANQSLQVVNQAVGVVPSQTLPAAAGR